MVTTASPEDVLEAHRPSAIPMRPAILDLACETRRHAEDPGLRRHPHEVRGVTAAPGPRHPCGGAEAPEAPGPAALTHEERARGRE